MTAYDGIKYHSTPLDWAKLLEIDVHGLVGIYGFSCESYDVYYETMDIIR